MDAIFTKLRSHFERGDVLVRLLLVNAILFLITGTLSVITALMGIDMLSFLAYFELPARWSQILLQPWSLLSYMFLHTQFFHFLFNMLWLYWFGQLFLRCFSTRQLLPVYLLGGICGGLLFLLSYTIFPALIPYESTTYLLGASASILAIVVATAVIIPDAPLHLLLLGEVRLKYIALFVVVVSFLNVASDNAGGNIAHLGGAAFGYFFAKRWQKGDDITRGLAQLIDRFLRLFKPRVRMDVHTGGANFAKEKYQHGRGYQQVVIDAILDKIKRSGYESLSEEEKKKLFQAGKK